MARTRCVFPAAARYANNPSVAEGEVGVEELPRLHLLVDDAIHQVADFLFVGVFKAVGSGLDAVGHHQDRRLT